MNEIDLAALAAFTEQDDAALFIGSGVSLWSGLPSWHTFIRTLIDYAAESGMKVGMAQSALHDGRLADAADALEISPLEIANLLRTKLGFTTSKPHLIHGLITQLGPTRFITTNYDTLLEQQLGLEGKLANFRSVTSSRVAEMADILKASADNFIFKAHGDINDAETMIVSARDYERVMLGSRNIIRRGLEMLLVSRPILFIGYGLRDPDLNLILRSLTDTFAGNIHHLYAIVGNVSDEERDYWWRRFRIRVYGYAVGHDTNGREDHSSLIKLLEAIVKRRTIKSTASIPAKLSFDTTSAIGPHAQLMRYAAGLVRDPDPSTITLSGRRSNFWEPWPDQEVDLLNNRAIKDIIKYCPTNLTIVGIAGSGKSRAFKEYMSTIGNKILSWGGDETTTRPPIPVMLDARLYEGSFTDLMNKTVPSMLNLASWSHHHRIDLLIDSLDEMPQSYLDSGEWRSDLLQFANQFNHYRLVYGSRRSALVGSPETPAFEIDALDPDEIKQHIAASGLAPEIFSPQLLSDVTSPFILSLIVEFGRMVGDAQSITALLAAAIESYVARVPTLIDRTGVNLLIRAVAYDAVMSGRETILISDIVHNIDTKDIFPKGQIDPLFLVDSLVRSGLLISEIESRVRFAHRSITEYLCSSHILALLSAGDLDLPTLLANRRWDAPITWALSSINSTDAINILPSIYNYDKYLAFRIVTCAEHNRALWWRTLLKCLKDQPPSHDQMFAIHDLNQAIIYMTKQIISDTLRIKENSYVVRPHRKDLPRRRRSPRALGSAALAVRCSVSSLRLLRGYGT